MYGCESWTIKKAEHRRIDAFELWCWRRLRVPWTARRSNQSILKEISSKYSLEGLMLKLKLQYFCYLMLITNSFEKTLMLRKIEDGGEGDNREWNGWMASQTQWTWVWVGSSRTLGGSWKWTVACQACLSIGILQERISKRATMLYSRGSSQLRDRTKIFHTADKFFTVWATREFAHAWRVSKILDKLS